MIKYGHHSSLSAPILTDGAWCGNITLIPIAAAQLFRDIPLPTKKNGICVCWFPRPHCTNFWIVFWQHVIALKSSAYISDSSSNNDFFPFCRFLGIHRKWFFKFFYCISFFFLFFYNIFFMYSRIYVILKSCLINSTQHIL